MNNDQKRQPINLFSDKPNLQDSKIDLLISTTNPVKREQPTINLFTPISNLNNEKIDPLLSVTKPNIRQGQPTVNLFIPMSNLKNRDIDPLIPTLKLNTKDVQTNTSSGQTQETQEIVDSSIKTTIIKHNLDSKDTLDIHPRPSSSIRIDIRRIRGYSRLEYLNNLEVNNLEVD